MPEFELESGESIIKSVRKHWFVLAISLVPLAFLALLPTLFIPFMSYVESVVPHTSSLPSLTSAGSGLIRLVYGLWLLVIWSVAFNTITSYYLNEWIITTTRIIEIHQFGFFSREVSSLLLVRVQDVSTDIEGLFATMLGYGQLEVQSAGTEEHFIIDDIADPQGLRDIIMKEIAALHADGMPQAVPVVTATTGV